MMLIAVVMRLRISRKDITDVEINVDGPAESCTGLKCTPECKKHCNHSAMFLEANSSYSKFLPSHICVPLILML